jgi:hypothetical protein
MEQARQDRIIPYEVPTTAEGKDSIKNFLLYHFVRTMWSSTTAKLSGALTIMPSRIPLTMCL